MKLIDLIVVDAGNTRCKVGLVHAEQLIVVQTYLLAECDNEPWRDKDFQHLLLHQARWIISGSNPPVMKNLARWLISNQQNCTVIDASSHMPLAIKVKQPERAGRDRLLNALGVPTRPAIIISAGTAITVDAVDADGSFLGGAIFPGMRLMAQALNDHTAALPLIDPTLPAPDLPGKSTEEAMHAGIVQAAAGGIVGCITEMLPVMQSNSFSIYITGGDAEYLMPWLPWDVEMTPHLALQGLIVAFRATSS